MNDFEYRRAVREIQQFLRYISLTDSNIPYLTADGKFGPETQEAVKMFQRGVALPATGTVNTRTWETLRSEYRRRKEEALRRSDVSR